MFGVLKAFFGVVETQGRGALDAHNLAWVRGMPPTVGEVVAALQSNPAFCQRFSVWADSVSTAALPASDEPVRCPLCSGAVAAVDMPCSSQRN